MAWIIPLLPIFLPIGPVLIPRWQIAIFIGGMPIVAPDVPVDRRIRDEKSSKPIGSLSASSIVGVT